MGFIISFEYFAFPRKFEYFAFPRKFDIQELKISLSGTIQIQAYFCKRIVAYQHMCQQYQYQLFTSTGLHDMPKSTPYTS